MPVSYGLNYLMEKVGHHIIFDILKYNVYLLISSNYYIMIILNRVKNTLTIAA